MLCAVCDCFFIFGFFLLFFSLLSLFVSLHLLLLLNSRRHCGTGCCTNRCHAYTYTAILKSTHSSVPPTLPFLTVMKKEIKKKKCFKLHSSRIGTPGALFQSRRAVSLFIPPSPHPFRQPISTTHHSRT